MVSDWAGADRGGYFLGHDVVATEVTLSHGVRVWVGLGVAAAEVNVSLTERTRLAGTVHARVRERAAPQPIMHGAVQMIIGHFDERIIHDNVGVVSRQCWRCVIMLLWLHDNVGVARQC